ncbi:MAG TPA: flagellar motor protein MotB [Armatimonadota bacterium]|nr:flagellar motor protein MotB [Armatimonadota bacterium]
MGRRDRSSGNQGEGGHDGGGALRWVLTYADMITLLMAFFIMLYSMSVLNMAKFQQVATSIKSGFGGMVEGQGRSILGSSEQFNLKLSPIPNDISGVPDQTMKKIQTMIKDEKLENKVRLRVDERGLVISLATDKVLFGPGRATLSRSARKIIDAVADTLKDVPNEIRVEGHTCDLPIRSSEFPSNWELSTARATNVIRYLIDKKGFQPGRLSAAGYADSRALVPNTSEFNRAINRRVDIVVLRSQIVGGNWNAIHP